MIPVGGAPTEAVTSVKGRARLEEVSYTLRLKRPTLPCLLPEFLLTDCLELNVSPPSFFPLPMIFSITEGTMKCKMSTVNHMNGTVN